MDLDRVAAGFDRIVGSDPPFDQIADGTYFGEGPVWDKRKGRFLSAGKGRAHRACDEILCFCDLLSARRADAGK